MDREHRLNAALLRSGKFKEAIGTLMEWMRKMDDTLAEQKLTSTDHKFLKSQLQMQQVSSSSMHCHVVSLATAPFDLFILSVLGLLLIKTFVETL